MAPMAFLDSKVNNDKSCSKTCLTNYEALKKPYDDLLIKLDDTGFKAATYKRGLTILEDQIIKYKEHEVLFSEEIALLKRSVEKKGFEFKIAKFNKSAKDLSEMLESQITDKSKKGVGYHAVPSHPPLILNRPTPLDLSYLGLEEFKHPKVNEYGSRDSSLKPTIGCDKESDNSKENTDDSLEQHQITDSETSSVKSSLKVDKDWKEKFFYPANHVREVEPKKVRENNDAPIIEDWVSDDEDDDEPNPKVEKKTVIPTATKKRQLVLITFNTAVLTNRGKEYAHKHMAPRAVLMKTGLKSVNTARPINTVMSVNTGRPFSTARSFNTVRPSYTAQPKSIIHCAIPRTYFQNQAQSTIHRPFYKRTALTKRYFNQRFNTSRPFRSTVNTVRARGCWVWMPKNRVVDHVSKNISASVTLKRLDYIDAQGRFKWMHRLRGGKSAAKKKKNPKEGASKAERPRRMTVWKNPSQQATVSSARRETVRMLKITTARTYCTAGYRVSTACSDYYCCQTRRPKDYDDEGLMLD
ncbi:hypothetical protein Tco_0545052 [Tanacetum coccineum]